MFTFLKYPVLALLFFIFAMFQVGFLPHIAIAGVVPNLVLLLFFAVVFHESSKRHLSTVDYAGIILLIVFAGFLLDVFASVYLGLSIASLLIMSIIMKWFLGALREMQHQYILVYFMLVFCAFFLGYAFFISILTQNAIFESSLYFEIAYNAALALVVFIIYKKVDDILAKGKQLQLL
jgi:hypothetical protein